MNKFIKKLFGIDKLEAAAVEAAKLAQESEKKAEELFFKAKEAEEAVARAEADQLEQERLAKISEKDRATERQEPYFKVIGFHTNPENPRFGFWELDWNQYKVTELKEWGYYGETDEEIVNQWFTDVCRDSGQAVGANMDRRSMGFIDVKDIGNGRSEVS